MTNAIPLSTGMWRKNSSIGFSPPAEAPIPTIKDGLELLLIVKPHKKGDTGKGDTALSRKRAEKNPTFIPHEYQAAVLLVGFIVDRLNTLLLTNLRNFNLTNSNVGAKRQRWIALDA